jgi:methionyl-tRNA formyltransferase
MRIVFMGSPAFAVPALEALLAAGHEVAAVYSQPPRPSGRGQKLTPTPVHALARARGLPVHTPASLRSADEQAAFAALDAELAVVVAYGLILPRAVLDAPRLGCINLHGSLLPRWRGAAPIQRAILAGDAETGVQVMGMEAGLDTGPVYLTARTPIGPDDTAGTLGARLSQLGAGLLVEALVGLAAGTLVPVAQSEAGVTYAAKIERGETRIDWTQDAAAIDRQIRAFAPSPGAWCLQPDGTRLKVLLATPADAGQAQAKPGEVFDAAPLVACGRGALRLLTVQREGKSAGDAASLVRSGALPPGALLA